MIIFGSMHFISIALSLTPPILGVIRPNAWEPRWTEPCFEMMNTWPKVKLQPELFEEGREYYIPMLSRLYLNRFASAITGIRMEDLKESSLYYDSCLKIIKKQGSIVYKGFGGKTVEYQLVKNITSDGYQGKYFREDMTWDEGGYTHVTLTDSKKWFFMPDCTLDNKKAWSVVSAEPVLSDYAVRMIHKHAQELGFTKEYFTRIRYDKCT